MQCQHAYLVFYADPFDNFKQSLAQPLAIVSVAESREAKESALELPLRWHRFLDPMACDRKVTVCIAGFPSIAC